MRAALLATTAAAVLGPLAASAHEVLRDVERGRGIAVKAYFANGEALAYAQYEVFSPADPKIPHQKGRTDRNGYVAFVPDTPGKWRVKVVDATGHGLEFQLDAEPASAGVSSGSGDARVASGAAFVLRPLLGLALIGAVFAALVSFRRKKGSSS